MHPLAAPGTLWVLSSDGKYLVRPQADETSHKKQISCGRQGKGPFLLEDFASAEATKGLSGRPLETFGSPCSKREAGGTVFLWKARERAFLARGFRLCGGDQRAFRSPPGPLWEISISDRALPIGCFYAYWPKNTKTTNQPPLPHFLHYFGKDIDTAGIHLSCPGEIRKE